jgi:ABC-2 type transport system ATP-binding protein
MIEVENLTKRYGSLTAVKDISFTVDKGEIVGFLGPNGAGKTTTMRVLTCFLSATEGSARVAGFDIFDEPLEVKKRIGYLPESPPLYRDMRVRTYLEFVANIKGVSKKERAKRTDMVMERTGLTDRARQEISQLSKGYRQRVGLAQAIIHDPEVIILDEPTSGLDPNQTREVRGLIKELAEDKTVILSTHILPEVSMTCSRVIIINNGEISAVDTPGNLSAKMKGNERVYVEVRGDAEPATAAIKAIPGVLNVEIASNAPSQITALHVDAPVENEIRPRIVSALVAQGIDVLGLRREEMSLEDIFVELTTDEMEADGA